MNFCGRTEEITALRRCWQDVQAQHASQMVTVFGRRRVGKTALLRRTFENEAAPVLSFLAQDRAEASLASAWTQAVCRAFGVACAPDFRQVSDVLSFAMSLSRQRPAVFLIDECQVLERRTPGFWAQLQSVWGRQRHESQLLLVLCGSGFDAMERLFGGAQAPLFSLCAKQLEVHPFPPSVIRQIVADENPTAAPEDLLTVYAMTSGLAGRLQTLSENGVLSRRDAVRFLFSRAGAWLRRDGAITLTSEYRAGTADHREILHAVAQGASTWSQIEARVGRDINGFMEKLEKHRLLTREKPLLATPSSRLVRYRISDLSLAFWLTFVDPIECQDLANLQRWDELVARCEAGLPSFLEKALAEWLRAKFQEEGAWPLVGRWWNRQSAIDLVAVDSNRRQLLLGEASLNPSAQSKNRQLLLTADFLRANPKFADWSLECRRFTLEDL